MSKLSALVDRWNNSDEVEQSVAAQIREEVAAQIATREAHIASLNETLAAQKSTLAEIPDTVDSEYTSEENARESVSELESLQEGLDEAIEMTKEQKSAEKVLAKAQARYDKLKAELEIAEQELADASDAYDAIDPGDIDDIKFQIASNRTAIREAVAEYRAAEKVYDDGQELLVKIEEQIDITETAISDTEDQIERLKDLLISVENESQIDDGKDF